MIRKTLRWLTGAALLVGTFWNLYVVDVAVANLEPRAEEDVTFIQNRYLPIEFELIRVDPKAKRIGYITPLTAKGEPPDALDDLRWAQLRYVMIPRILVRGTDEPYVIGNFKAGEPIPQVPENLVQIFDAGTGMILYKQKQAP